MYEFTHAGLSFRWSSLNKIDKRLARVSVGFASMAAVPIFLLAADSGFRIGLKFRYEYGNEHGPLPDFTLNSYLAKWGLSTDVLIWISLILVAISLVIWWRFSVRQDEMFNRVQNWALGFSGTIYAAISITWSLLADTNMMPAISGWAALILYLCLFLPTWMIAARRWV